MILKAVLNRGKYSLLAIMLAKSSLSYGYDIPVAQKKEPATENIRFLQNVSRGVSDLAEKAGKSIVFVSVSKTVRSSYGQGVDPFEFFFGQRRGGPERKEREFKQKGLGSGFIIDLEKGYILSNNHVIADADEITVKLANGKTYEGKVKGRDKNTDIAVIQISDDDYSREGLEELRLGNSDNVKVGEIVIAMGAPFGLEASLTMGVLSATGRGALNITTLGNFMQTDAAINPGNSGGPLIDTEGNAIGINTAIYSKSGGSAGIGFAVPANLVRKVATQLINSGKVSRGYLGVSLPQDLTDEIAKELKLPKNVTGALISKVEKDTPAFEAGLKASDVIVKVNNTKIKDNNGLRNTIGLIPPKSKIKVEFYRNGKLQSTNVTLADFSVLEESFDAEKPTESGLTLKPLSTLGGASKKAYQEKYGFNSSKGLIVVGVAQGSEAEAAGIQEGDVLISADRTNLSSLKDFDQIYTKSKRLLIKLERKGSILYHTIRNRKK